MYMFRLAYGAVSFFNVRSLYKLYHRHHPTKLTPTPSFYANTHAPFSLKGQHFPPNNLLVIYNRLLIIKKMYKRFVIRKHYWEGGHIFILFKC